MTRFQLLLLLVAQARANGFEFRRWYIGKLGLPWQTATAAVTELSQQHRYYALLFSHEFATSFWKPGKRITFQIPTQTFTRRMADGKIGTVQRSPYMRRSTRENAWLYHLREMAASEDPLRYMRRYLRVSEDLDDEELFANLDEKFSGDSLSPPPCSKVRSPPGSPQSASNDAVRESNGTVATAPRSTAPAPYG